MDAAAAHRVKPLLCHNLSNTYRESVPKDVLDQLQRYLQAHSLNNLFLTRGSAVEERNFCDSLERTCSRCGCYGDVALRQFGDLDILVREQDALKTKDLLLSSGYRPLYRGSAEDEAAFHKLRQVYEMVRQDGRVLVELHWAVTSQTFAGGSVMAVERPAFYIQLRERAQDRLRCRLYLAYRKLTPRTQAWTLRLLHSGRSVRHFLQRP